MDVIKLYHDLLRPSPALIADLKKIDGDIMILGVGGKMGPALARLAKQAMMESGLKKEVIGVSRFTDSEVQADLENHGIRTIVADLLDDHSLQDLPWAQNVLYLAGTKFGTTGKEPATWAMNSYLPGRVAEKFKASRVVVFSTGNVYPLLPVRSGGATEKHTPEPIGEYAQSCLGRERIFQYFSIKNKTPTLIYRLNYANDITYGVLLDIALSVKDQRPIDLRMGYVNVIWQGEANELAIRALLHCTTPASVLNITGPETISVKSVARKFSQLFNIPPVFVNEEKETALLSNASASHQIFGPQNVTLSQMVEVIGAWVLRGGKTLNKPTHFQEREGKF